MRFKYEIPSSNKLSHYSVKFCRHNSSARMLFHLFCYPSDAFVMGRLTQSLTIKHTCMLVHTNTLTHPFQVLKSNAKTHTHTYTLRLHSKNYLGDSKCLQTLYLLQLRNSTVQEQRVQGTSMAALLFNPSK